ncbi:MAG: hypothetical protein AABX90_03815, partial [Nanoarchaeota archaeon]
RSFTEWCCDKIRSNFPQSCGSIPGRCEYRWVYTWGEAEGLDIIRWLDPRVGVPEECDCSNSVLVIFGDPVFDGLLNYQIFIYNQIQNENGPCTFGVYVPDFDGMDNVVYNPETRINNAGKFKKIIVMAHGDSRGTAIDSGGSFGSLVCDEGYATLVSCRAGTPQILGIFGLPRMVANYCSAAIPGSKIKVSRTNIEVTWAPHLKFGDRPETAFDAENLVCTIEDPVCYQCTGQNPPTARIVSCDEEGFLNFPRLLQ